METMDSRTLGSTRSYTGEAKPGGLVRRTSSYQLTADHGGALTYSAEAHSLTYVAIFEGA
jgi:hypothetical protein